MKKKNIKLNLCLSLLFFSLCLLPSYYSKCVATTYYLNKNAQSGGNGTSMALTGTNCAWNKIADVNAHTFSSGDKILIARGTSYQATDINGLYPKGSGLSSGQITIDSYDAGYGNTMPIIKGNGGTNSTGIRLEDQDYWTIKNVEVTNNNYANIPALRYGILVKFNAKNYNKQYHKIEISGCNVHNVFASNYKNGNPSMYYCGGIYVWCEAGVTTSYNSSTSPNSRIDNVLIYNNTVTDITGEGIFFRGESIWNCDLEEEMNWNNLSTNIVIRGNKIKNVCDGIQVIGTDNVLIESNIVDKAGGTGKMSLRKRDAQNQLILNASGNEQWDTDVSTLAIAGIWPACSRGGIIQFNEVMNTKRLPGDGFALDNDLYNDGELIIQYNYSHDNEGGFFMDCEQRDASNNPPVLPSGNPKTILRYNISQNDGKVMNPRYSTYENPTNIPGFPSPFADDIICRTIIGAKGNVFAYNNVIVNLNNPVWIENWAISLNDDFRNNIFYSPNIVITNTSNTTFYNNCYSGGMENSSARPSDANALLGDPAFINVGGGSNGISTVGCYKLNQNSRCMNKGLRISNNGGSDFWGSCLYNGKQQVEIGAYEVPPFKNDLCQIWNNNQRLAADFFLSNGIGFNWSYSNQNLGGAGFIDFFMTDINNDDKTDLVHLWNNSGRLAVESYTSNGTGLTFSSSNSNIGDTNFIKMLTSDVNGDGQADLLQLRRINGRLAVNVFTSNGAGFVASWNNQNIGGAGNIKFLTCDINGDRRTDLLQLWNNGGRLAIEAYTSNGTGLVHSWSISNIGGAGYVDFLTVDINGDGRTDLLQLWNNGGRLAIEAYTSNGTGLVLSWSNSNIGSLNAVNFLTGDINKDGRTDIFQLWNNNGQLAINVYASNGSGFSNTWNTTNISTYNPINFATGDINADCRTDIFQYSNINGRLGIEAYTSNGTGFVKTWNNSNIGGASNLGLFVCDVNRNN